MRNIFIITLIFSALTIFGQESKNPGPDDDTYQYALIEASRQKMIGNINEAIRLYESCIKSNPECDVAYYELGAIYSALKEKQKGEAYLKTAFELNPENYWYGIAYSELLKINKKLGSSLSVLKKMRKSNTENALTIDYKIAEIYTDQRKFKKAVKILDHIEKDNGVSEMVSFMKIDTYKKMGKIAETESEILKLVDQAPDYYGYRIILAEFYTEIRDTAKAISTYEIAYELDSTNIYAVTNLANLFLEKDQNEKAFFYLNRAFENDEIEVNNKVQALVIFNNDEQSLTTNKDFVEKLVLILLEKYPDNLDVKTVAFDFYNHTKNNLIALKIIKEIIEKKPDNYIIWQQALYNASLLEDYSEILSLSENAIKLFPNKAELYLFAGMAYMHKGEFENAYNKLKEGYKYKGELEQNKIQYLIFLAESAYKFDRKKESFIYYDELLQLDPENILVKNNYSYFLALEGIELEKAEKLSKETIVLEPENGTYLDTYGWILFTMGKYQDAKIYLEKALKDNESNSEILFHFAEVLNKLGKFDESKLYYIKAEKHGYDSEIIKRKLNELPENE